MSSTSPQTPKPLWGGDRCCHGMNLLTGICYSIWPRYVSRVIIGGRVTFFGDPVSVSSGTLRSISKLVGLLLSGRVRNGATSLSRPLELVEVGVDSRVNCFI